MSQVGWGSQIDSSSFPLAIQSGFLFFSHRNNVEKPGTILGNVFTNVSNFLRDFPIFLKNISGENSKSCENIGKIFEIILRKNRGKNILSELLH